MQKIDYCNKQKSQSSGGGRFERSEIKILLCTAVVVSLRNRLDVIYNFIWRAQFVNLSKNKLPKISSPRTC